jgi:hypothetical protein
MPLTEPQRTIVASTARMRCVVSGRRFGKSTIGLREAARFAVPPKQKVFLCAPTYRQAKAVFWANLKDRLTAINWVAKVNEQDLTVTLHNGSTISIRGTDNFNSLRGVGLNFLVMDEFSDCHPDAWERVLRPTLSDTGGHALFLGTPRGRNHLYAHYLKGQDPGEPNWESWQFTTLQGGNVPPEEIEQARRELSEEVFNAEYNADFVEWAGRIYTSFRASTHCAPLAYNPRAPLVLAFDFNTAPGVCAVMQEQLLPSGLDGTGVIGEVHIKQNSTTPAVCRKVLQDWGQHPGPVNCYGDATGGAQGSARVQGSDWQLVRAELQPVFGNRLNFRVPQANPKERVRINAVNSRLLSAAGDIRMMVDPVRAPHVVRDFEGVQALEGGAGEIDKRINPELSHLSDAIGYYCAKEWPIEQRKAAIATYSVHGG